jgi:hypothetical protein
MNRHIAVIYVQPWRLSSSSNQAWHLPDSMLMMQHDQALCKPLRMLRARTACHI